MGAYSKKYWNAVYLTGERLGKIKEWLKNEKGKDMEDHELILWKGGQKAEKTKWKTEHAFKRGQINEYRMSHLRKEGELSTET